MRWDHHSIDDVAAVSPHGLRRRSRSPQGTRIQLGFGQYVQYPEITLLTSPLGSRGLLPIRSNQWLAAFEQRLGPRTRLRAEYYDRARSRPALSAALRPAPPQRQTRRSAANPRYLNSLRGYSRGVEVFLQRSSANRVTGWVSYAFGRTGMRDGVTNNRFPSDYDQRHTVNVYGGYRLKPTVNLSVKSSYGSGFPIPGYLQPDRRDCTTCTNVRNQLRMPVLRRAPMSASTRAGPRTSGSSPSSARSST